MTWRGVGGCHPATSSSSSLSEDMGTAVTLCWARTLRPSVATTTTPSPWLLLSLVPYMAWYGFGVR
eukprot:scaffold17437_cov173-Amphora_coffeaeformis.AAC.8